MDKCYGAKVLVFTAFVNKNDDLCISGYVNYCSFAIQYLIHMCELESRKIINHNSLFDTSIPSSTRRPLMIFMPGLQQKVILYCVSLIIIDQYVPISAKSDDESGDETFAGVGRGKKKGLWPLGKNSHGEPILPTLGEDDPASLNDKKDILRSFFTYSYRMFHFISVFRS
jgi:hypothetical protein